MSNTHTASCHCGAVTYEADIDLATEKTMRCNCSYCSKSRAWLAFVKPDQFRLLSGEEALTEYQWTPPGKPHPFIHYQFCGVCGVRAFAHGGNAATGQFYAINIAALDDADPDELIAHLGYIDGARDNFKTAPEDTRLL